jgi:hypothetical protein
VTTLSIAYIHETPMRRMRSGRCARAASGHARRAAAKQKEFAPSYA